MAYCTNCGNQLKDGANFCPKCGQAIKTNVDIKKRNSKEKGQLIIYAAQPNTLFSKVTVKIEGKEVAIIKEKDKVTIPITKDCEVVFKWRSAFSEKKICAHPNEIKIVYLTYGVMNIDLVEEVYCRDGIKLNNHSQKKDNNNNLYKGALGFAALAFGEDADDENLETEDFGENNEPDEIDSNNDVITDTFSIDSNGDGAVDTVGIDADGDGNIDTIRQDTNGDGEIDTISYDTDNDGVIDETKRIDDSASAATKTTTSAVAAMAASRRKQGGECRKCGAKLKDGVMFCPKCGEPISGVDDVQIPVTHNSYADKPEMKHNSPWQKVVAALFIVIGLIFAFNKVPGGCSNNTSSVNTPSVGRKAAIEESVKKIMVENTRKNGHSITITHLSLIHQGGNGYEGLAEGTFDGRKMEWDVYAVCDGENVKAEWQPTVEYLQKENNRFQEELQREYNKKAKEYQKQVEQAEKELERIEYENEMQMRMNGWN